MSKKRQKQFGAISIFFRTLITAFSIFVAIATILGCVKITQNAEETIEVGANVQNATIKWLFWDVSDKAVISINTVDTTKIGDYKISYIFGIRILNQDLWETIISFIISANNNIPRIKGIIERLSKKYGNEIIENQDMKHWITMMEI